MAVTTSASFCLIYYKVVDVFGFLISRAEGIDLIYTELTGMISAYCKVSVMCGVMLALPIIIYEIVMFIRPALLPREKRYLYSLLPGVMLSFAAGVAFGFYVLLPPAMKFLITFGADVALPMITVGNYVSIVTRLLFAIGLCFELPLLCYFLTKIGVVTPDKLAKYRKIAIVVAFILGAIITPTFDPINQSMVALPLIVLYEVGIILSKVAMSSKKATYPEEVGSEV